MTVSGIIEISLVGKKNTWISTKPCAYFMGYTKLYISVNIALEYIGLWLSADV